MRDKDKERKKVILWAKDVLNIEAKALKMAEKRMGRNFAKAVEVLFQCKGRVVVSGIGKAGIIGQKFSATLSSTGTPSLWVHAAEAVHGDLGRIKKDDAVVVLSYSGETDEIRNLVPFVKRIGAKIVAITGNLKSTLVKYADAALDAKVDKEACPLGLAPTTSTTVMLALCDALAVVLQKLKGFKEKDFAFYHPRGSLGRKLLLKVEDIMRKGKFNPVAEENITVKEALVKITSCRAGAVSIVDKKGRLIGIFTDGDLRRNIDRRNFSLSTQVKKVMTKNPVTLKKGTLASEALRILQEKKIDEVPVVDKNKRPAGMLDIQDLISAGVV